MNLSKERTASKTVEMRDRRFPGETYKHTMRRYTAEERLEYQRACAKAAGPAIKQAVDTGVAEIDVTGVEADSILAAQDAACILYDTIIEKVEGYTADDEKGTEVDAMTMIDWKELVPPEHKYAVIMEFIPQATIVKN